MACFSCALALGTTLQTGTEFQCEFSRLALNLVVYLMFDCVESSMDGFGEHLVAGIMYGRKLSK